MTTITDTTRWTPVRNGDIYCSPGCGFKCTHAAFERATAKAAELVKALGEGWEPDVWENGTWNYAANKGVARVHPPREEGGNYTAFVGFSTGQAIGHNPDPKKAVKQAVQQTLAAIRSARLQIKELAA